MKNLVLTTLIIFLFLSEIKAQVGINATNSPPHPSAMLDVNSTTKGLLIPRMSSTDKNNIFPKPAGLMVYDNTLNRFQNWNGVTWTGNEWTTVGNDIVNFNSGNVGIGNGAPQNKLTIGSTISPFAGNDFAIGNSIGGGMSLYQSGGSINGASIWYSNANFALMPVGGSTGSVGINNTNPSARLDVLQTGKAQNGFGSLVRPMRLGIGVTGSHAVVGDEYDAIGVAGFGANASLSKRNVGILGTTDISANENIGVMGYQQGAFGNYGVYGGYFDVRQSGSAYATGVFGQVVNTTNGTSTGMGSTVYNQAASGSCYSYGVTGSSFSDPSNTSAINFGVYGYSSGVGVNYGLYGVATGGTQNWALWADGNSYISKNLGIGLSNSTVHPVERLTVETINNKYGLLHTDGTMSIGTYLSPLRASVGTKSNHDLGFFTSNVASQMILKTNGRVGIGTVAPIAFLHVNGFGGTSTGQGNFFYPAVGLTSGTSFGANLSIFASDGIVSNTYVGAALNVIASDIRIKNILSISNNSEDLERLKKIQITNYTMKDVATWGNQTFKKVIAQQVEEVYPQVINKTKSVIPDIYALAESVVYDAQNKKLSISLTKDYKLKVGDKIELVHPEKGKIQSEVVEVLGKSFTVKDWEYPTDKIFVFGREVNDFRSVDYEALSMLGISAIQQLAKENDEIKKENAKQKEDFNNRLESIEASLKSMNQSTIK